MPMSDRPLGMAPIPPREWITYPVTDSSVYLDRPPVRYEGDADLAAGEGSPPPEDPLPDE